MKIAKVKDTPTPQSLDEIENWIQAHPKEIQGALRESMALTWNFMAEMVTQVTEFGGDSTEHL